MQAPSSTVVHTTRGLASQLAVGVSVVNRLRREGRIPFLMVGGQVRYELEAVLAALRATVRLQSTESLVVGGDI
jgi:excisionase family DNA binding protein